MQQPVGKPDKSPFASSSTSRAPNGHAAEPKPEPAAAAPSAEDSAPADKPHAATDAATAAAAQMANPAIWWNLLQEQFKQAVESAMSAEAMAGAAAVARNAASLATGGAVPAADAPKAEAKAKAQGDSGNASAQPGVQTPWPPKSGPGQG
jgi:hypothetical protein